VLELRSPGGGAIAVVDPEGGGRLTRLAVGDVDLLAPAGCFVMAPWAGRTGWGRFSHGGIEHELPVDLPPHAAHGTVRGVAWTVEAAAPDRARLSAPLGPAWPWPGRCEHTVAIHDDHLALSAAVHAEAPFPAVLGWHPWFAPGAAIGLDAEAMLERGADHLPTGRRVSPVASGTRPLDDCFEGVRWPVTLTWGDGPRLTVDADGCDHVVVFDELAHATCVEPQTAPPDALRAGTAGLVEPGRPLRGAVRVTWADR